MTLARAQAVLDNLGPRQPWPVYVATATKSDSELGRPELWPIERPSDQPLRAQLQTWIADGLLYREDADNGWIRIGLTAAGRRFCGYTRTFTGPNGRRELEAWRREQESYGCVVTVVGGGES